MLRRRQLRRVAASRRAERDAAHDKYQPTPTSLDVELKVLCTASIQGLQDLLNAEICTSEEITAIYIKRAHEIGFNMGAVTHELYDKALVAARASDARRRAAKLGGPAAPVMGLLEGIPISIKEPFFIADTDATCGLASRCGLQSETDGILITALKAEGAIPFIKTNVPQALMLPESDNNIYGRCVNPYSPGRTCGGSSGGEGAVVASSCSPIGIGTDIGGSIRIPAAFTGVFGFKPTPERLTVQGMAYPRPGNADGQNGVRVCSGPLGRCVEDLATVMRAWLSSRSPMWEADPTVPRLLWDEANYRGAPAEESAAAPSIDGISPVPATVGAGAVPSAAVGGPQKLRIGFFVDDGFWTPAPSCKRAVAEAVDALRAAGHEVVPFDPVACGSYEAALLYYGLMGADGALREFKRGLEGEALHPLYATLDSLASIPDWGVRPALAWALRAADKRRMGDMLAIARARRADEYWQLVARRDAIKARFLAAMREAGVSLLLTPGMGTPAFPHGGSRDLTPACSYTFLWNLLHFPAGTVPVSHTRADECVYECPKAQNDAFAAVARTALVGAAGLPVGVQLVGLPYQDELVLRGMHELEAALEGAAAASGVKRVILCPKETVQATLRGVTAGKKPAKRSR